MILDVVGLTIVLVSKTTGLLLNLKASSFWIISKSKSSHEISLPFEIGP